MRDTFKKTLAAAIFAMFVTLPLGAHAADNSNATMPSAPATVKEALRMITSTPKGMDGELLGRAASPINTHETSIAGCQWVCTGAGCEYICW